MMDYCIYTYVNISPYKFLGAVWVRCLPMEGNASVTIMRADLEMAILAGADLRGAARGCAT